MARNFISISATILSSVDAADHDQTSVHPDVAPRDQALRSDGVRFRAINFSLEAVDASMSKWKKVHDELFRHRVQRRASSTSVSRVVAMWSRRA
jgi:hypothetical protein